MTEQRNGAANGWRRVAVKRMLCVFLAVAMCLACFGFASTVGAEIDWSDGGGGYWGGMVYVFLKPEFSTTATVYTPADFPETPCLEVGEPLLHEKFLAGELDVSGYGPDGYRRLLILTLSEWTHESVLAAVALLEQRPDVYAAQAVPYTETGMEFWADEPRLLYGDSPLPTDHEFEPGGVIVVLKRAYSMEDLDRQFAPEDFPEIACTEVIELMSSAHSCVKEELGRRIALANGTMTMDEYAALPKIEQELREYRVILQLKLQDETREGVFEALAALDTSPMVRAAYSNFTMYLDDPGSPPPGDINGDGVADIDDILAVRRHIFGIEALSVQSLQAALDLVPGSNEPDIDTILAIRACIFGAVPGMLVDFRVREGDSYTGLDLQPAMIDNIETLDSYLPSDYALRQKDWFLEQTPTNRYAGEIPPMIVVPVLETVGTSVIMVERVAVHETGVDITILRKLPGGGPDVLSCHLLFIELPEALEFTGEPVITVHENRRPPSLNIADDPRAIIAPYVDTAVSITSAGQTRNPISFFSGATIYQPDGGTLVGCGLMSMFPIEQYANQLPRVTLADDFSIAIAGDVTNQSYYGYGPMDGTYDSPGELKEKLQTMAPGLYPIYAWVALREYVPEVDDYNRFVAYHCFAVLVPTPSEAT